jgi:hypothetical protein
MFFIDTEYLADWAKAGWAKARWTKTGRSILDRDGTERKAVE